MTRFLKKNPKSLLLITYLRKMQLPLYLHIMEKCATHVKNRLVNIYLFRKNASHIKIQLLLHISKTIHQETANVL